MTEKQKPKKLYHYTKLEKAIQHILPDKSLRMNTLINMNDPNENLLYITNYNEGHKFYVFLEDFVLAKKVQTETSILSFSTDRQLSLEKNLIKIKGYQLQRMWAQYGENNAGICLVLDYDKFINENKNKISENKIIDDYVSYAYNNFQELPRQLYGRKYNEPPSIESITKDKSHWNALKTNSNFVKNRFFVKNIDWEGESEYRFLTFENISEDPFLSIENSLEKVILGINSSRHFIPSVISKVNKNQVFYIEIFNGQLEIKEI
jgi:hypothetical protein